MTRVVGAVHKPPVGERSWAGPIPETSLPLPFPLVLVQFWSRRNTYRTLC